MTQPIQIHTNFDYAHIEELQRVVGTAIVPKETRLTRIKNVLWGGAFLVVTVLLAAPISPLAGVLFGIVSLYVLARGIFYYQMSALGISMALKANAKSIDYTLDETGLTASSTQGSSRYEYSRCTRLLETEHSLYFFMEQGQGLVLDKGQLQGADPDGLRAFLEERCGRSIEWVGKAR